MRLKAESMRATTAVYESAGIHYCQKMDCTSFVSAVPAGSAILFQPDPLEIKMGILLPGHRFDVFGFLDPKYGLPPLTEFEGNLLPVRTSGFSCKKIRKLMCYLDDHALSAWLSNIDPVNADSLAAKTGSTDVIVRVNGYFCPGLYSAMQTMNAEYLELRFLDVRGSRFSVRPVRRAEMETRKEPWTNAINRAIGKTIRTGIQVPGTREFMNSIFSKLEEPALSAPGGTLEDIVLLMADAGLRFQETGPVSDGSVQYFV